MGGRKGSAQDYRARGWTQVSAWLAPSVKRELSLKATDEGVTQAEIINRALAASLGVAYDPAEDAATLPAARTAASVLAGAAADAQPAPEPPEEGPDVAALARVLGLAPEPAAPAPQAQTPRPSATDPLSRVLGIDLNAAARPAGGE